jgi:hypothetical protein
MMVDLILNDQFASAKKEIFRLVLEPKEILSPYKDVSSDWDYVGDYYFSIVVGIH